LRHVHDLRIGGFQHHDVLALLLHGLDLHLVGRLQVARVDRLVAQALDGIEHARLVGDERLAELGGPAELHAHHVHRLRELHQCTDRRSEARRSRGSVQRLALEFGVLQQPVAGIEHLLRVRRCDQQLRQHGIRVQRDRREELLERLRRPRPGHIGGRNRCGRCCGGGGRSGRRWCGRGLRLGWRLLGATSREGGKGADGDAEGQGS
jgi:hypothetical protein